MDESGRCLIVCCDGTNNTLTAGTMDTNVLRLFDHIRKVGNPDHVLYYDPGVGTPDTPPPTGLADWAKRFSERVAGLALGGGIYHNITEAYLFLMRNWRGPQDRIYLFGFSRGAFTVRAVAGMLNLFGLLRTEHEPLLPTLVRVYFSQPAASGSPWSRMVARMHAKAARPGKAAAEVSGHTEAGLRGHRLAPGREELAQQIQTLFVGPERLVEVHWIGVWDTVESVGLPGPLSRSNPATATLRGKRMRHVRHALALDEHRLAFAPRIYEESGDLTGPQTLKQRWFPGAHCDAGGSYAQGESGISNAALDWMLAEVAQDLGIPATSGLESQPLLLHDPLYSTPYWALAGMYLRDTSPLIAGGNRLQAIEDDAGTVTRPLPTVWDRKRSAPALVWAVLFALMSVYLSGVCLLGLHDGDSFDLLKVLSEAAKFGSIQQGFGPGRGGALFGTASAPAWAMFWDFIFIGALGYLLGRVSSRAFAWLAGRRRADSPLPTWRLLGYAPMAAIGSDLIENLLTIAAVWLQRWDADYLSFFAAWAIVPFTWMKFAGWVACVPLLLVWIRVHFSRDRPKSR